ncbi:MAG: succinate--CoA ligase subunit alpha [Prolixibacteraceae bacterium]|jgi:succinyl-CoA synthetase alpha subunit|nr:succinate--CoA ligase subunit alpha [Prolixibacteraceae bacterium]
MSVFIDKKTRVLVQGITGSEGSYWTRHMINLGTNVVAGVTPGKGGQEIEGVKIYNTVQQAVDATQADAALLFVPPKFAGDAIFEALDAGIRKVVVTAEGIPLHEAMKVRAEALSLGATVIGGNTTGVITPGVAMMGFLPYWIERVYKPGRVGVMTRSGSLTNEATAMMVEAGYGVSSLIGVGGDAVPFTRFAELLPAFEADPETDAVLMIGELGGSMEEEVAAAIENGAFTKPLVAFIAGRNAPVGKKMGHAGAIISGGKGTVAGKAEALRAVGALVADKPSQIGELIKVVFKHKG